MHSRKKSSTRASLLLGALAPLAFTTLAHAQTWDGGGANNLWSNADNWNTTTPVNDGTAIVNFDGATRLTPDLNTNFSVSRVLFLAGASSFDLSGTGTLNLTGNGNTATTAALINNSAVLQTVSHNLSFTPSTGTNFGISAQGADLLITGDINGGTNRGLYYATSGRTVTVQGTISGAGSALGSVNTGVAGATLHLSGSNTYTGSTSILRGTLEIGSNGALAATSIVNLGAANNNNTDTNSASMLMTGAYATDRNILLLSSATAGVAITVGGDSAHASEFSGNITMGNTTNNGRALRLTAAANGQVTFSGNLLTYGTDNGDAVSKIGLGTAILSGAGNTYKGATTVSAGTLLFNGAFTGAGLGFSVSADATLGGTGTLDRAVTLASGATLLAGAGAASGTFTIDADVTFATGSLIEITLGSGGTHSTLARESGAWTFDAAQTFVFTGGQIGFYDNIVTGLDANSVSQTTVDSWVVTGLDSGLVGTFTFDGTNLDLTVTAIPEPSSAAALAGLALLGFAGLRRTRRAS